MKVSVVLATWLSCVFVIASAIDYPTVSFTTHLGSVGSYQSFISLVRKNLQSGSESHDIAVLRKPSEITDKNMFLLVDLYKYDEKQSLSVTIAISVVNAYVIAYKSGTKSFFLKDAPSASEKLLFNGTSKQPRLQLDTNYNSLGDRMKVGLGIGPIGRAIETLNKFDGKTINTAFKDSFLVVIQMVSEAARFKFIQLQIEQHILDEYKPKWDTISFENEWSKLSEQIQLSGPDGKFKTPVDLKNADGTKKVVNNVAQVKSDITILLYHASGERLGDEKIRDISAEEVVEEMLSVI